MTKRVYTLYRVSTKGQVEKDDIPMQRQRCHEFAESMGWEITREFYEKGVSGYKVSAVNRDAIQEIKKDAAVGKFDVLLVFMFDRLGRKDDETPFIVEWFVKNGIEVWSAVEGEQRFDNHVDKLMNYIRFWQASGESLKTSIRTKTRLAQIAQEGRFTGGTPPYGYRIVKKGRIGRKNKELYDLEVNPEEAIAIRRMFELADRYGYGGRKIATTLQEEGIVNLRTGEKFHYSTVQHALGNVINIGIIKCAETYSDVFPELQIVSKEQFDRVQAGRAQRSIEAAKKRGIPVEEIVVNENGEETTIMRPPHMLPRRNMGRTLLSGNIYCGHCGGRIFASTALKTHHKTKKPDERIPVYKCYNRSQYRERCDGPTNYQARKIDAVVEKILREVFEKAKSVDTSVIIENQATTSTEDCKLKLAKAKADLTKHIKELERWENYMLDSLEGKCDFSQEQVKRRMNTLQIRVDATNSRINELQNELDRITDLSEEIKRQHERIVSWAEVFDSAKLEEKRMIAAYMIRAVTVTRDYDLKIEFNISAAQFLNGMELE